VAQSPIAYRLSGIENKLDLLLTFKENPVDPEIRQHECNRIERNGVHLTLCEYCISIEKDIETAFSDVNRLGIIIGDIQEKLGMEVTA
jgi:hypothetical protein